MGIVRLVSMPFLLTLSTLLLRSTKRSTRTRMMTSAAASRRARTAPTTAPVLPPLFSRLGSPLVGGEGLVGSELVETVSVEVAGMMTVVLVVGREEGSGEGDGVGVRMWLTEVGASDDGGILVVVRGPASDEDGILVVVRGPK